MNGASHARANVRISKTEYLLAASLLRLHDSLVPLFTRKSFLFRFSLFLLIRYSLCVSLSLCFHGNIPRRAAASNGSSYGRRALDGPSCVEARPRQRSRQHLYRAGLNFFPTASLFFAFQSYPWFSFLELLFFLSALELDF